MECVLNLLRTEHVPIVGLPSAMQHFASCTSSEPAYTSAPQGVRSVMKNFPQGWSLRITSELFMRRTSVVVHIVILLLCQLGQS